MIRAATFAALALAALTQGATAQSIPVPVTDEAETRQISVTVTRGLTSMAGLPASLRDARARMHRGESPSEQDLRALADRGDSLAAQRYVRRLQAGPHPEQRASDIAYYAAIAVGGGRVWTLPDMVAAMERLDPSENQTRINKYISVLYPHAWAGNTLALDAVVKFNGPGKLFGPLSDATRQRILDQGRANGNGRVELRLALAIMERKATRPLTEDETTEARGYLQRAMGYDSLAVTATAENLMAMLEG